jgi:ribosome maturation factor RimP
LGYFCLTAKNEVNKREDPRMSVDEMLERTIDQCVEDHSAHVIDLVVRGEKGGRVVQVFVDAESGVTIDQCTAISRTVAESLSRGRLLQGHYRLEVSSPGTDRPLRYSWQYAKHVGRPLRVKIRSVEGTSLVQGTLSSADESNIVLETGAEGEPVRIRHGDIVEAKVVTPW